MEELVQQVSQRAGISEEQARTAVETVAEILKERIPSPYNKYVDSFLTGEGGGLGGMLSGMFGGK
jgi:nucleoid DNA-binding protein